MHVVVTGGSGRAGILGQLVGKPGQMPIEEKKPDSTVSRTG